MIITILMTLIVITGLNLAMWQDIKHHIDLSIADLEDDARFWKLISGEGVPARPEETEEFDNGDAFKMYDLKLEEFDDWVSELEKRLGDFPIDIEDD